MIPPNIQKSSLLQLELYPLRRLVVVDILPKLLSFCKQWYSIFYTPPPHFLYTALSTYILIQNGVNVKENRIFRLYSKPSLNAAHIIYGGIQIILSFLARFFG